VASRYDSLELVGGREPHFRVVVAAPSQQLVLLGAARMHVRSRALVVPGCCCLRAPHSALLFSDTDHHPFCLLALRLPLDHFRCEFTLTPLLPPPEPADPSSLLVIRI